MMNEVPSALICRSPAATMNGQFGRLVTSNRASPPFEFDSASVFVVLDDRLGIGVQVNAAAVFQRQRALFSDASGDAAA